MFCKSNVGITISLENINSKTARFEKFMVNTARGYNVFYLMSILVVFPLNESSMLSSTIFFETVTLIVIGKITPMRGFYDFEYSGVIVIIFIVLKSIDKSDVYNPI